MITADAYGLAVFVLGGAFGLAIIVGLMWIISDR